MILLFFVRFLQADDFEFESSFWPGPATLKKYNGQSTNVEIPKTYDRFLYSHPVTAIDGDAFSDSPQVENITFPSAIDTIGSGAFSKLPNLKTIGYIDDDGVYHENELPPSYSNLESVTFANTIIKKIIFTSENSIQIRESAFENCSQLTEFNFSNVNSIEPRSFKGCSSLTQIDLQNSQISALTEESFSDCSSLNEVIFPTSLEIFDPRAFTNSPYKKILFPGSGQSVLQFDDCFRDNSQLEEVIFEDWSVNFTSAFSNCVNLQRVVLPQRSFDLDHTFCGCTQLQEVTGLAKCNSIEGGFDGCVRLKSIDSLSQVVSVGSNSFRNCNSLTSVTLSGSFHHIGVEAFRGCNQLTTININVEGNLDIESVAFSHCESLTTFDFSHVTTIGEKSFEFCQFSTLDFSNTPISSLSKESFSNCPSLKSLIYSPHLSTFKLEYFSNSPISSYTFPESDSELNLEESFSNDQHVTEVIFSSNTKVNLDSTFLNCKSLVKVTLPSNQAVLKRTFVNCSSLQAVFVDGVNTIDGSFENCQSLTTISGELKVTTITASSFRNCKSLKSLPSLNLITTISPNTFSNCNSLSSLPNLDKVTIIGSNAFSYCISLTSIDNVPSLTSIDSSAFSHCDSLTTLNIPKLTKIGSSAFEGCSKLEKLLFSNQISDIEGSAFKNCEELNEVTIEPSESTSELHIGKQAFQGCQNLLFFEFRAFHKLQIEEEAFDNCPFNDTISFGFPDNSTMSSVRIGSNAFSSDKIEIVDFMNINDQLSLVETSFSRCSSIKCVEVVSQMNENASIAFSPDIINGNQCPGGSDDDGDDTDRGSKTSLIVGVTIGVIAGVALIVLIVVLIVKNQKKKDSPKFETIISNDPLIKPID